MRHAIGVAHVQMHDGFSSGPIREPGLADGDGIRWTPILDDDSGPWVWGVNISRSEAVRVRRCTQFRDGRDQQRCVGRLGWFGRDHQPGEWNSKIDGRPCVVQRGRGHVPDQDLDGIDTDPASHRVSDRTNVHDAGSDANDTPDGLTESEEAVRQAAEDIPTGSSPSGPTESVPVFDRGSLPPKV